MLSTSRADWDEEGHIRVADLLSNIGWQSPTLRVRGLGVSPRSACWEISQLSWIEPHLFEMYIRVIHMQSAQDLLNQNLTKYINGRQHSWSCEKCSRVCGVKPRARIWGSLQCWSAQDFSCKVFIQSTKSIQFQGKGAARRKGLGQSRVKNPQAQSLLNPEPSTRNPERP